MHNGYINVDKKKMSKSLGNFFTTRDVAEKYGYEPIRFLMLASHYRSPIEYNVTVMEQCKASLERLNNCRDNIKFILDKVSGTLKDSEKDTAAKFDSYREKFIAAMDDDLNTADAISVIFELVRDINTALSNDPSQELVKRADSIFTELTDVLGLIYTNKDESDDSEIESLIAQRTEARKNKDWATADKIRDQLKAMNIILEDTPQGIKWHRA